LPGWTDENHKTQIRITLHIFFSNYGKIFHKLMIIEQ
jgi:hypothetical protein